MHLLSPFSLCLSVFMCVHVSPSLLSADVPCLRCCRRCRCCCCCCCCCCLFLVWSHRAERILTPTTRARRTPPTPHSIPYHDNHLLFPSNIMEESEETKNGEEEKVTILPEESVLLRQLYDHFASYGRISSSSGHLLSRAGFIKLVESLALQSDKFRGDTDFIENVFADAVASQAHSSRSMASFETLLAALGHVASIENPSFTFAKALRALLEVNVFPVALALCSSPTSHREATQMGMRTPRPRRSPHSATPSTAKAATSSSLSLGSSPGSSKSTTRTRIRSTLSSSARTRRSVVCIELGVREKDLLLWLRGQTSECSVDSLLDGIQMKSLRRVFYSCEFWFHPTSTLSVI